MKPLKYYFHKYIKSNKDIHNEIRTKSIRESYDYLKKRMRQDKRLFFVRFGDGEFVTMLKRDHRNYVYNEGLAMEIEQSFRIQDENYLISCPINYPYDEFHASGIYKQFSWQQEMIDLMNQKGFNKNIVFENPCIFQCMAVFKPKELKLFFDEFVRPQKKLFIGSTPKAIAEKLYGKIDFYVEIPSRHAYESIDEWWSLVEEYAKQVDLIIPSAGSTSNAIALRLWNQNVNCKLIDFGSIIDAVDEKETRSWIRLQGHKVRHLLNEKDALPIKKKLKYLLKDIKFLFRNQVM